MPRKTPKRTWLMPQEVIVWYILPAIRRELTRVMIDKGIAQKTIARMLGVTEPAITQYKLKRSKRSRGDQIEIPEELMGDIEESADIIHKAWKDRDAGETVYETMTHEVNRLIDVLRDAGVICEVHREHCEHAKEDCSACKDD